MSHAGHDNKLRTKNCRVFYKEKVCLYGSRCNFRHEHKRYDQILRHYYTPKLYALESLFHYSKDQSAFVEAFESGIKRLDVFKNIHKLEACDDEESTSLDSVSARNDDSLSFIEMEDDIKLLCKPNTHKQLLSDSNTSLNTSIGSSEGSVSAEAVKEDSDESIKAPVFDLASQMRLQYTNDGTFQVMKFQE